MLYGVPLAQSQKGFVHLLPIVILAVLFVGVVVVAKNLPQNQDVRSRAQMKMEMKDECLFSDPQAASLINNAPNPNKKPAFCDSFETLFPGGRGGDLDESRWSVARVTQNINTWEPTDAMFCLQKLTGVLPDKDSFICGLQFNEPNHWMSAMNDGGSYQYMSARPRQQFDFTGRTGSITFAVDAMTEGEHGWWPEVWVTDEPAPGPYNESPGIAAFPKNGIQISFGDQCASFPSLTHANVQRIRVFKNYQQVAEYSGQSGGFSQSDCYLTKADAANHFEIRINTNKVEVWGSDFTQDHGMTYPNFKLRAWTTLPLNLSFSRGYVHFEHIQYNAGKFGSSSMHTFHWHALGFDGPVLPMDRGYDVSDSLTPQAGGSVNIGYEISRNGSQTAGPFTLGNVDLTGATGASLNFNGHFMTDCFDVGCKTVPPLRYRLNGKTWHDIVPPFPFMWGMQRTFSVPISLSELTQGTNSLEFQTTGVMDEINLANIDITVITNSKAPLPSSSPTTMPTMGTSPMPSMSMQPTPTPSPTVSPTVSPSPSPSGTRKLGDLNNDNAVDIKDLSILLVNWLSTNPKADINSDGHVNVQDLSIMLSNWGK